MHYTQWHLQSRSIVCTYNTKTFRVFQIFYLMLKLIYLIIMVSHWISINSRFISKNHFKLPVSLSIIENNWIFYHINTYIFQKSIHFCLYYQYRFISIKFISNFAIINCMNNKNRVLNISKSKKRSKITP